MAVFPQNHDENLLKVPPQVHTGIRHKGAYREMIQHLDLPCAVFILDMLNFPYTLAAVLSLVRNDSVSCICTCMCTAYVRSLLYTQ